jgi:IclR family transcriptional regulator, KDG regulon repressor
MKSIKKNETSRNSRNSVQSLDRALDLLEVFPKLGPEVGLTNIAEYLGLNKATAYRLLSTLEQRGFLERSPYDRSYRLGVRLFELGAYYQNQINVRHMAMPYLAALVEDMHEAAFLCIRDGDDALCIERMEAEQEVKIFALRVGGRLPLHTGAAPRVLLAGLSCEEVEDYVKRSGLPAFTPKTIISQEDLLKDIQTTLKQGYTLSIEDVTPGISAVGAPIWDYRGQIIASVSVSGLTSRFDSHRLKEMADAVKKTAQRISRHMGFVE